MNGRLAAWSVFILAYIAVAYASRTADPDVPDDLLYRYSTAIAGAVQYAVVLAIVLWLARGPARRELLALRRPRSLSGAFGFSLAVIVGVYIVTVSVEPFLHAAEEQGLTPPTWEPQHAGAYAANFVVIAGLAPIVEELLFRGIGYSLWARFGQVVAILVIGISFGLVHGLIGGLVILSVFGAGLAWLRARTASVYPCIAVHALFNSIAMIVAVTT